MFVSGGAPIVGQQGRPWSEFAYGPATQRVTLKTGGDPRLHDFETEVREKM